MAADTREPSASAPRTVTGASTNFTEGRQPEASSVPVAPPNANALPAGAGQNTAGGKVQEAGIIDALRSIKPSEVKEVHQKPCVRDSLLTGIGGGFGVGGVRAIWGGMAPTNQGALTIQANLICPATVWSSCNWAVGSFVFGSFLMYEFCQRKRALEKQGMKRAVEVIDRKQAEKQKKADEARVSRRRAKEEADARS